jgi:3-isopropylmalate/(R)-2-methylmalate dehydratase small subunit
MKKTTRVEGKVIPLNMDDVDTDLIIPAQYLTLISQQGFGTHLFQRLRDTDPNFVFNQPAFKDAQILIAQHNFGCGSSREHAVWALQQAGINAIIAISFADIFANNAAKNGLILITQPEEIIFNFLNQATSSDFRLTIDLVKETIFAPEHKEYPFTMNSFHRYCFINGYDELDYLLEHQDIINNYWDKRATHFFVQEQARD